MGWSQVSSPVHKKGVSDARVTYGCVRTTWTERRPGQTDRLPRVTPRDWEFLLLFTKMGRLKKSCLGIFWVYRFGSNMIVVKAGSTLVSRVFKRIQRREKIREREERIKRRIETADTTFNPEWQKKKRRKYASDRYQVMKDDREGMEAQREKERNQITRRIRYVRKGAKLRDLPCPITEEQMKEIMQRSCIYYNFMPKRGFNEVDRRNNTQGNYIENLDPCCSWCNRAKSTSDPVGYLVQCMHIDHYQRTGELLYPECFGKPAGFIQYIVCK